MKRPSIVRPLAWFAVTVIAYGALYHALYVGGHAPSSVKGLLMSGDNYYGRMRFLIGPALVASWLVLSTLAFAVGRRLGLHASFSTLAIALATACAAPLLLLLVVPDLVILKVFGFEEMTRAFRYYAAAAPVAQGVLGWRTLRRFGLTGRGATLTICVSLMGALIVMGVLVR